MKTIKMVLRGSREGGRGECRGRKGERERLSHFCLYHLHEKRCMQSKPGKQRTVV